MLKIIEIDSVITEEVIYKYIGQETSYFQMQAVDGKFNIDSINEYLNYFTHVRMEGEICAGVIKSGEYLSEYHQNKLLKTFEESDDDQVHLLFIDRSDRLLETILSRGILIKEQIGFKFLDTELHNFAKPIISNSSLYQLLLDEDPIFRDLYKINKNLRVDNVEQAIINCSSIKFDKNYYQLFNNLVANYLYETKRLELLKTLFEIELKTKYQVNLGMQALTVLLEIKNNKEYYERSNWN